jgi:ABC-type uncharacterized transport system ATPase subunit
MAFRTGDPLFSGALPGRHPVGLGWRHHRAGTTQHKGQAGPVDDVALDANGLTKRFGAVVALDDLSLQVPAGEARGLLGPNGAGKTTLLRIAFGLVRPDAGELRLWGRRADPDGGDYLTAVAGSSTVLPSLPT